MDAAQVLLGASMLQRRHRPGAGKSPSDEPLRSQTDDTVFTDDGVIMHCDP
jgi:hypothetical protein